METEAWVGNTREGSRGEMEVGSPVVVSLVTLSSCIYFDSSKLQKTFL